MMKKQADIAKARRVIRETLTTPGLSDIQRTLFGGMLNALVWVANDSPNGSTVDRLLAGEPIAAGQDHATAMETLREIEKLCPHCGRRIRS